MVGTASTGAHVDRNGDVPGPSPRAIRSGRAAGDYTWQLHPLYAGTQRRANREVHRIADGQVAVRHVCLGRGYGHRRIRNAPDDRKQSASVFVGQWAPTLLILGLYNKLVKQHGSDFTDTGA